MPGSGRGAPPSVTRSIHRSRRPTRATPRPGPGPRSNEEGLVERGGGPSRRAVSDKGHRAEVLRDPHLDDPTARAFSPTHSSPPRPPTQSSQQEGHHAGGTG